MGKKKTKNGEAQFKTRYAGGTVAAAVYDAAGNKTGYTELVSSEGKLHIAVMPEEKTVREGDIVYIPVSIRGENDIVESNADRKLTVSVENGTLLAFGSADPCTEECYDAGSFTTYYGHALAVVYAGRAGKMKVTVQGSDIASGCAEVAVEQQHA